MAGGGALQGAGNIVQGTAGYFASKEQEEAARKWLEQAMADRTAGVNLAKNLDWSPERVRDNVGVYQRSRSPVADAFLESFVTGDNPAAVQGTRYGSHIQKADAQRRFDQNYGGWDQIRAKQRELDAATPWKVEQPGGFTYGDQKESGKLTAAETKRLEELLGVRVSARGDFVSVVPGSAANQSGGAGILRDLSFRDGKTKFEGDEYIARLRRFLAAAEQGEAPRDALLSSKYEMAE